MKSEIEHQNALSSVNRRFEKSGKEHCLRTQKITSELTSVATIARAGSSWPAEIASCVGGAPLISSFLFAQQYLDGSGCHGIRNRLNTGVNAYKLALTDRSNVYREKNIL